MNEEQINLVRLIANLLVQAGCVMEDISPQIIGSLPTELAAIDRRVNVLKQAAEDLDVLASAAATLLRLVHSLRQ
jgi:hypothetical protein